MSWYSNADARVAVIGRTDFETGIGSFTYAACELFSRHAPTSIIPTDQAVGVNSFVELPSGRSIPHCVQPELATVFFYTEVLFNGSSDKNIALLPAHGLKIAHLCFDSDQLPPEWVEILNGRFDAAYLPTVSQVKVAQSSGVRIPLGILPIALPLENLLSEPWRHPGAKIRFGSLGAFHPRKEHHRVVEAFIEEFGHDEGVELCIHSNLGFDSNFRELENTVRASNCSNIFLTHFPMSAEERDVFLGSLDVFVNCSRGEGYSVGAREALALGKTLVVSDLGVHEDFVDLPGVYRVDSGAVVQARYPEIDGRFFGVQKRPRQESLRRALRDAHDGLLAPVSSCNPGVQERRLRASEFSFDRLSVEYATIIDPSAATGRSDRGGRRSNWVDHPEIVADRSDQTRGGRKHALLRPQGVIVPCHDGGFFSVFNAYLSHMAWGLEDDRCHMTIPDWDQRRLSLRMGTDNRESFCYGTFSDGNLWSHFFEMPFGRTLDDLNDAEFLYEGMTVAEPRHNEYREPLLTYKRAYDLYRSPWFLKFRIQYNEAFQRHVHVKPEIESQVSQLFDSEIEGRLLLSAHVKHPSHVLEQASDSIADARDFILSIKNYLQDSGCNVAGDDWRLFLATDQESVVEEFQNEFGDNVVFFKDVRRTTLVEDSIYREFAIDDPGIVGHQVQHLVASEVSSWSTLMGVEILRDAIGLSRADVMFHVVSNVVTGAAVMNPMMRLVFVDAHVQRKDL
jgi:glycosyltransferase involved in cell wall biosynthesis